MPTPSVIDPSAIERVIRFGGDDMLEQLVAIFARDVPLRLAAAREAANAAAWNDLADAVHSVKSTAGNLGAVVMQSLAQDLEHRSRRGDPGRATERIEELECAFREALAELRQRQETQP